jgi:hypothetical protein
MGYITYISRMRKYFLNFILLIAPVLAQSQVTLSNPYSYYGIGILANSSDPIQRALGNSSFAYTDSTMVNYYNSASHASGAKGYPLFSLSLNGQYSNVEDGGVTNTTQYFGLEHMYLSVPFAKRFGLAMGINPYARRGYAFQRYNVVDGDSLRFEYEGKGNISKAFVALSANLIQRKNLVVAVGTNLGYLYGQVSNSRTSVFVGESKGGVAITSERLRSFHYDVSASVRYNLNEKNNIHVSAYYDPSQKLRTSSTDDLYYFETGSASNVLASSDTSGRINSAPALKLGLNYAQKFHRITKKNKEFDSELNYVVEYQNTAFTDFGFDYKPLNTPYTADFSRVSLGIQYTPNIDLYKNFGTTSIWNRMKYRVGAYSSSLPYQVGNTSYKEFGTTFGIGIPLVAQYSYSSLNLGFNIGKRSNTEPGAINESFVGFNVGIIISPSSADKWFRKVKLD